MRSSDVRFAGTLAGVGRTGTGYARPTWRQVTCPREGCGATSQVLCRRRISESFNTTNTNGHQGEGRWASLKHPHPERVRLAKESTK